MNKAESLDELKNSLTALEEKEQQDILKKYTQHIDMKIERGLSEEEAIEDFDDLDQLTAETLETCHVNPDYSENRTLSPALRARDLTHRTRSGFLGIARAAGWFLHRIAVVAMQNTGALIGKVRTSFSRIPTRQPCFLRHLKTKMEVVNISGADFTPSSEHFQTGVPGIPPISRADHVHDQSTVQNTVRNVSKRAGSSICRMIKGMLYGLGVLFSSCLSLVLWYTYFCLHWTWNTLPFILTSFNGCLTLLLLYLLIVFLVWTARGCSFAGPALLDLGVVLYASSSSIPCISLLGLRRNTGGAALSTDMDQNASEEVQHA